MKKINPRDTGKINSIEQLRRRYNLETYADDISLPLEVADGGTGAQTAAAARAELGAASANHSHEAASSASGGFLSAADKARLDSIDYDSLHDLSRQILAVTGGVEAEITAITGGIE